MPSLHTEFAVLQLIKAYMLGHYRADPDTRLVRVEFLEQQLDVVLKQIEAGELTVRDLLELFAEYAAESRFTIAELEGDADDPCGVRAALGGVDDVLAYVSEGYIEEADGNA